MTEVPEFTSPAKTTADSPLEGLKFKLDGVEFECKGQLSLLEVSELAAKSITDGIEEAAQTGSIYQTLSMAFGPDVYPEFRAHVKKHRTSDETLLGIIQWLNEAVQANVEKIADRPTVPSSSSSPGPEGLAGQPVRSISADRRSVTMVEDGDAALAARLAGKQPAAVTPRPAKTRARGGSARRSG